MSEECKEKFPRSILRICDAEIAAENEKLKQEIYKLNEELQIARSTKKDLEELVIKLNMRMYLNY
ncbi:hypothetical protein [Robinsoniella sp. KNHs210]|uniref:hypothetical protein n=1 Tax=Robinsoniella sp. KNHs210 TaxID=1469950 RepID=UPI0004867545|nr:hypothetical protein [Robinsoniella sp. KNHs210]